MRIDEAIRLAQTKEHVWFRPVRWRAREEAVRINDMGCLVLAPLHANGQALALSADDVVGHWEVVRPSEAVGLHRDVHHVYVSATDHERWEMFGLPGMDEIMEECETCRECYWGDDTTSGMWFWYDDELMAIISGSWSNYSAPGALGFTCACLYNTRDKYEEALAKWQAEPKELEPGI